MVRNQLSYRLGAPHCSSYSLIMSDLQFVVRNAGFVSEQIDALYRYHPNKKTVFHHVTSIL